MSEQNQIIDYYKLQATIPYYRSDERKYDDPAYQSFLTFETKAEYLDWRYEWRDAYATLSQRIRDFRKDWRAEGSDHNPQLHNNLFRSRALARAMLELRKASKKKAQRLYEAEREAVSQSA